MEEIKAKIEELSEQLEQISLFKTLRAKTGVPTGTFAIGLMSVLFLLVFVGFGASLIVSVVGILYPAYMSFKAIESAEEDDDKMWLTYWVIFAVYNFADRFVDYLFFWVPFWFVIKLVVLVWMFFPQTKGAIKIYHLIARPIFKAYEARIDQIIGDAVDATSRLKKN
jgi:receptor expression-enhancing protein 5/6